MDSRSVGQLERPGPGLDEREGPTGVSDDVRVGAPVHVAVRLGSGPPLLAERLGHVLGPHPAVPIPLGPAVAQADAVHHAVTGEPVVRRWIRRGDGVGSVAQVSPTEGVGDVPVHTQLGGCDLLGDRGEIAFEVRVRRRHSTSLRFVGGRFHATCQARRDADLVNTS